MIPMMGASPSEAQAWSEGFRRVRVACMTKPPAPPSNRTGTASSSQHIHHHSPAASRSLSRTDRCAGSRRTPHCTLARQLRHSASTASFH